jgi:hypothetical protein
MELVLALLLRSRCLGIQTRFVPTLVSKHIAVGTLMGLILRFHRFKLCFDHSAVISPATSLFMELTIGIRIISRSLMLIGRVITATIASMIGLASSRRLIASRRGLGLRFRLTHATSLVFWLLPN